MATGPPDQGPPLYVLGINADQADVSAALLADGEPVAAIEEERLNRVKHSRGFPELAVRRCLELAGIEGREVDHVALAGNPRTNVVRRSQVALRARPTPRYVLRRLRNAAAPPSGLRARIADALGVELAGLPPLHRIEHHPAHLASAFLVSPFPAAALCSADGFGDFVSTTVGRGEGTAIDVLLRVPHPHSLGLLYTAVTQLLGFGEHGDEYKVMGLAAHGEPRFAAALDPVVEVQPSGDFRLDLSYFERSTAWYRPAAGTRDPRAPRLRTLFSPRLEELLGPARAPGDPLGERHADVAASLQLVFERALLAVLRAAGARTGLTALCAAGGCFMNSVLNGKIRAETSFEEVFVQPAAGDNGLALGAALALSCGALGGTRSYVMEHAYLGPGYGEAEIEAALAGLPLDGLDVHRHEDEARLCRAAAALIADGLVVGWFQGRMEWGSRALGNRSILADPRRADMRERLNERIKRREAFRPFAPSVLEQAAADFFEDAAPDPFMMRVVRVREGKRDVVPAVVHVDGTARPHTVDARTNPRFYALIRAFEELTRVPMVLNTSLNESEPIVETPAQALDCFRRTGMDAIVLGRTLVRRRSTAGP